MFSGAKETHPDILRGGHRNPYQLENVKSGGTVFCIFHMALIVMHGNCVSEHNNCVRH